MTQSSKPALLLLPNLLGDLPHHEFCLPQSVDKAVASLDGLISESVSGGRRYLGRFETKKPAHHIPVALYNKQTPEQDIDFLLEPIRQGERWGFVSDAGLPAIADPGAKLIRRARASGILVQAFIGPCSITHALMLSGLNGQSFTFHGYLQKDENGRNRQLLQLEDTARKTGATQIFMEAPHRNLHLLSTAIEKLNENTWLCVATELTLPTQTVVSQPICLWRKSTRPNIEKKPTLFLIGAENF